MTHVCAKLIPKLLTVEQKMLRFQVVQDNLEMGHKWCKYGQKDHDCWCLFKDDHETKQHSSQWKQTVGAVFIPRWLFSLIIKVFYIMNILQEVRQSIKNFRVTQWEENGSFFGKTVGGFFTRIMASAFGEPHGNNCQIPYSPDEDFCDFGYF